MYARLKNRQQRCTVAAIGRVAASQDRGRGAREPFKVTEKFCILT